jgi:hypothetical protein
LKIWTRANNADKSTNQPIMEAYMSNVSFNSSRIEYGVYNIPLHLADPLESQRDLLQSALFAAQRRLRDFAQKYNWQVHVKDPFVKSFHVYADKTSFDYNLLKVCELDTTLELPATYCAALEQDVLMSVSPELYRTLYPEGEEEGAFEKLLTHEMAHRLHIRILDGNEEAMGPVWFYEGFALYAAGQFWNNNPALDITEIWEIVNDPERGSYRRYAAVFRYFLGKASIHQLIDMAGRAEFVDWLKEITA